MRLSVIGCGHIELVAMLSEQGGNWPSVGTQRQFGRLVPFELDQADPGARAARECSRGVRQSRNLRHRPSCRPPGALRSANRS